MKIADISVYQGNINWELARKELDFVIFRASVGNNADTKYIKNATGCGIPFGAYHYFKAGTAEEAEEEALPSAEPTVCMTIPMMCLCAAALVMGFRQYDPEVNLAGVILNRLGSDTHRAMIEEALEKIRPGKYRHFKGNEYEVTGIARHSETGEPMVVYRALYRDGGLWVRPAEMWNETVTRDGKTDQRFTRTEEA